MIKARWVTDAPVYYLYTVYKDSKHSSPTNANLDMEYTPVVSKRNYGRPEGLCIYIFIYLTCFISSAFAR